MSRLSSEENLKEFQRLMNDAVTSYDKGRVNDCVGQMYWAIGFLADELFKVKVLGRESGHGERLEEPPGGSRPNSVDVNLASSSQNPSQVYTKKEGD